MVAITQLNDFSREVFHCALWHSSTVLRLPLASIIPYRGVACRGTPTACVALEGLKLKRVAASESQAGARWSGPSLGTWRV